MRNYTRRTSPIFVRLGKRTWPRAGCQYRRRALDHRRGVAGDVVLVLVDMSGSSIVDNVSGVLSFFLVPLVDVIHSNNPCIIVLQIVASCGLRFFIFHRVIQVVFPSSGCSSCFPYSLCRYDKPRIPLSGQDQYMKMKMPIRMSIENVIVNVSVNVPVHAHVNVYVDAIANVKAIVKVDVNVHVHVNVQGKEKSKLKIK